MRPLKVRMVVYAGAYLQQAFRHHACRVDAVAAHLAALDPPGRAAQPAGRQLRDRARAARPEAQKPIRRLRWALQTLCSSRAFMPALVMELLSGQRGFLQSCLQVQRTLAVFFPLHVASMQMWWRAAHLGFSSRKMAGMRAHLFPADMVQGGHRGPPGFSAGGRQDVVRGFRCRFCGLLRKAGAAMMEHQRATHHFELFTEKQLQELLQPQPLNGPRRWFEGPAPVGTVPKPGAAVAALALRQPGACVPSLELVGALTATLVHMVASDG
jgi:hypothetical protein